ncbi:hypothetical protein JCM10450v2_001102 [Rhodotorula kratochvilovae]
MPDMKEARLLGTPSASPTLSTTSRGAPSPSSAPPPAHQQQQPQRAQPSAAELKAKAAAAVARTRIVADPSIASAFRREDDDELWELFTR